MDKKAFTDPVILSLRGQFDAKRHEMAKGYYPTRMEVIGVTNAGLNTVFAEYNDAFRGLAPEQQWEAGTALCRSGIFEAQQLGYMLLHKSRKAMEVMTRTRALGIAGIQDNWVSVDTYSVWFSGRAWRLGLIPDEEVLGWTGSEDRWIRRRALVSTVALNQKSQGGTGDTPRTLAVCEVLVSDRDDMVVKALSWALRELSKRERQPVVSFMERHEGKLAGRVRREVWTKLNTGRKNG